MTAEPAVPAEEFARLMRALFNQPATDAQGAPADLEAEERARLRRDVLDLLAGRTPESRTSTPPEPEPPAEPRDQFAEILGARLTPKES